MLIQHSTFKIQHYTILLSLLMLVCVTPVSAQTTRKKKPVDAVLIGSLLTDQVSLKQMENICEYYDLEKISGADTVAEYRAHNGDRVRFSVRTHGVSEPVPTVTVYSTRSPKALEKKVAECGYEKDKEGKLPRAKNQTIYTRGNRLNPRWRKVTLTKSTPNTVLFQTIVNKRW